MCLSAALPPSSKVVGPIAAHSASAPKMMRDLDSICHGSSSGSLAEVFEIWWEYCTEVMRIVEDLKEVASGQILMRRSFLSGIEKPGGSLCGLRGLP